MMPELISLLEELTHAFREAGKGNTTHIHTAIEAEKPPRVAVKITISPERPPRESDHAGSCD